MRVLLAEDDSLLANVVVEALTDDGHAVTHVATADQVLARSEAEQWDVFLLDSFGLGHDEVDEITGQMLAKLSARAPVVLTTGRPWASHADPARLGVAGILPKPYDLDQLSATLARIAAQRASVSASADSASALVAASK